MKLQVGDVLSARSYPVVTPEQLKLYADASGDQNPIHQNEAIAKSMGLPGIIAHGMLVAGYLADRAVEAAGGKPLKRIQLRFKAMTLPGDTITITGSVRKIENDEAHLVLEAKNQRSELVSMAQITVPAN